jgi:Fe-S-cluster-containing hydrogenase component 2
MSHLASQSGYSTLIQRLNWFPQGAPPSELLTKILALLFTEKEAALIGQLPIRPVSPATAAQLWMMREVDAFRILEGLAERALLLDTELEGEKMYVLPPPMAGFFGYALMRVRKDIDQEGLSELLYQYLNLEQDFVRSLFTEGKTRFGRILVGEEEIPRQSISRVLNYERASETVKSARKIGVGTCHCRHKMQHVGKACAAPTEVCMTFDAVAESLIRHGNAREVDKAECLDLIQQSREQNLVQFTENVERGATFLCNCCGCCCDSLQAARKFCSLKPIQTTNFAPQVKRDLCSGCGECIDACPVMAKALVSAKDPQHPWKRRCIQDAGRCLGCGVCIRVCKSGALSLVAKGERVITPVDTAHRTVLMAIERGKLQNLIWDNQAMGSHRVMAAIVGVIFRLPPVKQSLANSQLKSRYLDIMIQKFAARSSAATLNGSRWNAQ